MNQQLALTLQLNDEITFTDFCWQGNQLLKFNLEKTLQGLGEQFIYIWGTKGSGKSCLLKASCNFMSQENSAIYLPLDTLKNMDADIITGIETQKLICIDDIAAIGKNNAWEEAIFHLYNKVKENGNTILIISGNTPVSQLPIVLADLRSRLAAGLSLQLHELSDEEKLKIITQLANKRGFNLAENVAQFLLNRCSRSMHELYYMLNRLDEASLSAKRKITIPFVKRILDI